MSHKIKVYSKQNKIKEKAKSKINHVRLSYGYARPRNKKLHRIT